VVVGMGLVVTCTVEWGTDEESEGEARGEEVPGGEEEGSGREGNSEVEPGADGKDNDVVWENLLSEQHS
jgi:hypothetical protein